MATQFFAHFLKPKNGYFYEVKHAWIFLLVIIGYTNCYAQQLFFFKPNNLVNVPSSECYNIMQDQRGFIWFSTEAGLCRFNGRTVKVYNKDGGLTENAVYTVNEDKKGKLWVSTSANRILYYDAKKDSFIESSFSQPCRSAINRKLQEIYRKDFTSDSLLYVSTPNRTIKINTKTDQVTPLDTVWPAHVSFLLEPDACIPIKYYLSRATQEVIARKKTLEVGIQYGIKKITIPVSFPWDNYFPGARSLGAINNRKEYFIAFDRTLIKISPDLSWKIITADATILDLYCDGDGGVWLGTYKNGVFYYPGGSESVVHSLPDLSVTGICEDAEHGIWCTTLEKGVFYSRSKYVINYANNRGLDQRPEFLKVIGNSLFTSSDKNELFELNSPFVVNPSIKLPASPGINDLVSFKNKWLIGCKGPLTETDLNFSHGKIITFPGSTVLSHTIKQFTAYGKRTFALHRNAILEIIHDHLEWIYPVLPSASNCILGSSSGFFLGCKDGLYQLDTTNYKLTKLGGINGSVTQLFESADHTVWIVVREQGLFALRGSSIKKLPELPKLAGARYFCVSEDPARNLWIASNLGLIKLRDPFAKPYVLLYTSSHGLNSTEQLFVSVLKDRIYTASTDGLCSFPISTSLINETSPRIYIHSIHVNGKIKDLSISDRLKSNENNLVISLDIPAYKQAGLPVKFFYQIEGLRQSRVQEGTELSLENLSPGNYVISFYAINSDGKRSAKPEILRFTISKPFWQTPLFLVGALFILISLTYFIVKKIILRIQKKEEEKTRVNKLLAEYQMSALRAQMNPHFIFNCINSIQKFVLSNSADEAYEYLQKFSMLIRLVLNYAEKNLITLAQELEIVELYLELEQLRFDKKFTYNVSSTKDIDANECMVPVMLMQPYIENAIWHGLMNLEDDKQGHIDIKMQMEGRALRVTIEDNGVGLEKSSKLRKTNHQSKATDINSRRTQILNVLEGENSGKALVENIIDKNGSVKGTRVVLIVPQTKYEDE